MDAPALSEFGISLEVGEEYRMGWYEHTFVFVPPVAGIRRLRTGNGAASFTLPTAASRSATAFNW